MMNANAKIKITKWWWPVKMHLTTADTATKQWKMSLWPQAPVLTPSAADSGTSGLYPKDSWKMQVQNRHSSAQKQLQLRWALEKPRRLCYTVLGNSKFATTKSPNITIWNLWKRHWMVEQHISFHEKKWKDNKVIFSKQVLVHLAKLVRQVVS